MLPLIGQAKRDKILSQFSQMYRNNNYIAEKFLPRLKVVEKTGLFAKYGKENMRVYKDQIYRAPGTRAHSIDYSVSQGSYACRELSLEKLVPDEFKKNTDQPYDAYNDATEVALDNISINNEAVLAEFLSNTANLPLHLTLAGPQKWSDEANSDPIRDIEYMIDQVRINTGVRPNKMGMGYDAWYMLKYHPLVREQLKYTNGGQLSDGALFVALKEFFRLDDIFVGDAMKNTNEATSTPALADVWGDNVWVFYQNPAPTRMKATLGYTFEDEPIVVDRYREESKKSDVIRVSRSMDQCIMDTSMIFLLKDVK